MKVAAVICEYNPFHLGHQYHLNEIKKAGYTHIVAVMSGNFVQRGEVAIISKWARTKLALSLGVDLVIELPTIYSMSSAERFAMGSIKLLDSLGTVGTLSFGSECADLDVLKGLSQALLSDKFKSCLSGHLKKGMTFAKARELALQDILGKDLSEKIKNSNDLLAVEYIKSLKQINSNIRLMAVKRVGACHDEETVKNGFASASLIRKLIKKGELKDLSNLLPSFVIETLEKEINFLNAPADLCYAEQAIICKLRMMSKESLSKVLDVSEGIESRIISCINKVSSLSELYNLVKTKRYTHARIRRIILSAFLGITKKYKDIDPPYLYILGLNEKGREVLRASKQKSRLPIITRASDIKKLDLKTRQLFNDHIKFDSVCSMFTPKLKPFKFQSSIYCTSGNL